MFEKIQRSKAMGEKKTEADNESKEMYVAKINELAGMCEDLRVLRFVYTYLAKALP
jgi:hypothetical protein